MTQQLAKISGAFEAGFMPRMLFPGMQSHTEDRRTRHVELMLR
jgi:hypothetical protein